MKPTVEIISLIYYSTKYARHIADELAKTTSSLADISWRLVANDPTPIVKDYLLQQGIPHSLYFDDNPNDYYLNRVYRAWNFAGSSSEADLVCFVNSDMIFDHEGKWLDALIECYEDFRGNVIPCSLLMESGRMPSKYPAFTYECGKTLDELDRRKFYDYCLNMGNRILIKGGLYMPCLLPQVLFDSNSSKFTPYPEGNIYISDGKLAVGKTDGEFVKSGDEFYFDQLRYKFGLQHLTVSASRVYHWQSGEMFEEHENLTKSS